MTTRNDAVNPVTYDRSRMEVGIVHFGVGNFHRSHQAMYLDRLLRDPETFDSVRDWAICGVGVRPGDRAMRDALRSQDFAYTLVERHPNGEVHATRIGSILDFLYAPDDPEAVLERLVRPETRIVSLTITEGGYNLHDADGQLDVTVAADLRGDAAPGTVFGYIVEALRRRRDQGVGPFTVMSCDNMEMNGDAARQSFTGFAQLLDPELAEWIQDNVPFPNSMVDRITPVTGDAERAWAREELGVDEPWPVVCEDFVQWVLEGDFVAGRPPFEQVGVQVVDDVRPYELMKLRLLNAGHQALAHVGMLAGYELVHEATLDPVIREYLLAYMQEEGAPTLEPVPGIEVADYIASLLERFSNPYVRDTTARLATDASDRITKFLVPVIEDNRRAGKPTPLSAAVVAAWVHSVTLFVGGAPLEFNDRQEVAVRDAVARETAQPGAFLQTTQWFGNLAQDAGFVEEYLSALEAFRNAGDPRSVIEELVQR